MENTDVREELEELSDEELIEHFQQGVVEAFNILVDKYSQRLYYFALGIARDKETSHDIVQETWLRVYRNRHSYKPEAKFATWLYTIAGNLAKSEYRKRGRRKTVPLVARNRQGEEYEFPFSGESLTPEESAHGASIQDVIQEAFEKIGSDFREVVVLRDVQELSYGEIAAITGLPMGTVKSRIHRGRYRLQKELAGAYLS